MTEGEIYFFNKGKYEGILEGRSLGLELLMNQEMKKSVPLIVFKSVLELDKIQEIIDNMYTAFVQCKPDTTEKNILYKSIRNAEVFLIEENSKQ